MLEREPFLKILITTLESYFNVVKGKAIQVSLEKSENARKLFLYYKPSFISERFLTQEMRKFLYSEYNIRGNIIKFLIGKLGVFIITHSFGQLAKIKLYLRYSEDSLGESIFISPCNRSIRFYYFEKGYVDCIVKEGYGDIYMHNQLSFRLKYRYSFIPNILTSGERWYREKIMYGNPLIRVRNQKAFLKGQTQALENLKELKHETLEFVNIAHYITHLKNEIFTLFERFPKHQDIVKHSSFVCLNEFPEKRIKDCFLLVPVAMTHGDFQGGNIWLTEQKEIIIYDWETNKRRSIWFDPATLFWDLHSNYNGIDLINLEHRVKTDDRFLVNDENKNYSIKEKIAIASIIMLENVVFFLEDIIQLPKENLPDNFSKFIENLTINILRVEDSGR